MTAPRRPAFDVHHVRHLILTCTTALGLAFAAGCDGGAGSGGNGEDSPPATAASGEETTGGVEEAMEEAAPALDAAADALAGYPGSLVNPSPEAPPRTWFETDVTSWEGRAWHEIDLFRFLPTWPSGLASGTRYVVFYSRTCDHCEEMFYMDLAPNPDFARQVTVIEIPEDRETMTSPDGWPLPENAACEMLALPLGANFVITSPLALRIENGVITCAREGDHKECLGLE